MRHCVVTPEVVPLVRNGGVGSNALHLAAFLCRHAGHEVVILMTQAAEIPVADAVAFVERHSGATLVRLDEVRPLRPEEPLHPEALERSLRTLAWLEDQTFDVIHFMQYQAAGFASIRAKRIGRAFLNTRLITILNSPERWLAKHGKRPPQGSAAGHLLDYMERYSVQWSDHVTCPSRALLDWLRADGWRLAADTRWLPTYSPSPPSFEVAAADRTHLVFFGRLETRKGLELFVEALIRLAARPDLAAVELRITFLGKVSSAGRKSADTYLREMRRTLPPGWHWELISDLDHEGAMRYLHDHSGALYVMPSRSDNAPNTVTECLHRGLRVLGADVPGVSELFANHDHLVPPTVEAWASRLRRAVLEGEEPATAACPPAAAVQLRLDFLAEVEASRDHPGTTGPGLEEAERITVVVPHHNMGRLLTETLHALAWQTDGNFEVVVVDDGSTCRESLAILTAVERGWQDRRFRFVRQAQRGVCAARNHGAALGHGELLVFVDADNLPLPAMLATMRHRLQWARLDAVTCDLYSFDDGSADPFGSLVHSWAFVGGCLEASVFGNCLGDANLMIRREAFEGVGGFRPAADEASADRALLTRLLRSGLTMDATDECLFAYRRRAASMSRTADSYDRGHAVMEALTEGLDPWLRRLLEASFPIYLTEGEAGREAGPSKLVQKNLQWRERYRIEKAKRRERDQRVDYLYDRLTQWRRSPLVRLARFLKMIPHDY